MHMKYHHPNHYDSTDVCHRCLPLLLVLHFIVLFSQCYATMQRHVFVLCLLCSASIEQSVIVLYSPGSGSIERHVLIVCLPGSLSSLRPVLVLISVFTERYVAQPNRGKSDNNNICGTSLKMK